MQKKLELRIELASIVFCLYSINGNFSCTLYNMIFALFWLEDDVESPRPPPEFRRKRSEFGENLINCKVRTQGGG